MEPILRMETVLRTHPSSMAGELQEDGGDSLVRRRGKQKRKGDYERQRRRPPASSRPRSCEEEMELAR